MTPSDKQRQIAAALHASPSVDSQETIFAIVEFLKEYLIHAGSKGYVLGISGGQDSALCGRLAQLAVEELRRDQGMDCSFCAVRLPYGAQRDEDDAQLALRFIQPDRTVVVNIRDAVDGAARAFAEATGEALTDYHKGNVKARERMTAQYALAGQLGMLVLGTDHAAEAVTGFFTKFGDGACDATPLAGLTKRQGKQLLQHLGAPARLYEKAPTADLEELQPLLPDEQALGVTYEQLDDYLEGKACDDGVAQQIEAKYDGSRHKRAAPVTRFDSWWRGA